MENFTYYNPTRLVFGKNTIAALKELIPVESRVLLIYGGGSIRKNGVYGQVKEALTKHIVFEFGGVEPNPSYETCMKAVRLAQEKSIDFLLAAGGGSVIDAAKFIAAAVKFEGREPWDIIERQRPVNAALPLGCVLTLPASGSEANSGAVISRLSIKEKRVLSSDLLFPKFSILDPETTYSLPDKQTANGVVDSFVHVLEQYLTYPVEAPLQDRQAEALLTTILEYAPKVKKQPKDYGVRATLMWCATQALNGVISCGAPEDWTTHAIGHELTALYGIDHAQSLAIVLPGVLKFQSAGKRQKLLQYAERVWQMGEGSGEDKVTQAIHRTETFFQLTGVKTRLSNYRIPVEASYLVADRLTERGVRLGEHKNIGKKEIEAILELQR